MLSLFDPISNAPRAAKLLLDILDVKISETTLKKEIEEHPDYPSLLSISDVLKKYGVENLALDVQSDKLITIPAPFITQIRSEKSSIKFFTVVKEITVDSIHFFDHEKNGWSFNSKENFLKREPKIVLLTEAEEGAGEKGYYQNILNEKKKRAMQYFIAFFIPAIVVIAGTIACIQNGISALLPVIFSVFALAGSIIGVLLLWYEIDQHNPALYQICSAGKKVNCSAILQSKASKIAGISWGAIGFSYFTGTLLTLLFSGITNPRSLFISAWLNVFAVPYIVFSVYYQWRIAKQWCILCITAQGLLALQLITSLIGGWHSLLSLDMISPGLIISVVTAFAIPFIVTTILLPALNMAKGSKHVYTELQRLKHNPYIFEAMLGKQKTVTESPKGLGITMGNPNARYRLIKVCNPYCKPCAKAHSPMEELLHNNPEVQIQVLFTATNEEGDIKTPPVKHLLAIARQNDETLIKQALDDWYLAERKDYEAFAAKYPMSDELKQQDAKIEAMRNWCDKVKIEFTPTFFISIDDNEDNRVSKFHQLPEMYSINDLKYFFSV